MAYRVDESISTRGTIEALRTTLKRLEEWSERGDPMLVELKSVLLRTIGEIERRKCDDATMD